jgi:hypothetical protein
LDENLETYDIILLWSIQQIDNERCLKTSCLLTLLNLQTKYKYIILDYIEDVHNLQSFYGIHYDIYLKNFSNKTKNYILVRNQNSINENFPDCNYYTIPFSVEETHIPSFNQKPLTQLLLTGCTNKNYYPLRSKITLLNDTYPICILPHPGYRIINHNCTGKLYFDEINKYIASVSTCSILNYIVAKYFEIPASGALLFAYVEPVIDDLTKYGFKDMVNMIVFNNDNLIQKIEYILDPINKDEIDKIRLNGYNLILKKHTHNTRFYIEFNNFIDKLLHIDDYNFISNGSYKIISKNKKQNKNRKIKIMEQKKQKQKLKKKYPILQQTN